METRASADITVDLAPQPPRPADDARQSYAWPFGIDPTGTMYVIYSAVMIVIIYLSCVTIVFQVCRLAVSLKCVLLCSPSNYRPVSITSIACKTLENVIHCNLMDHMECHNILSDHQHGFRKRRSCEVQIIQAVDDLAKCLNDDGQIDAVPLDVCV